jgi:hypothetical protein
MLQSPPSRTNNSVREGGLCTLFAERLPQQIRRFLTAGVIIQHRQKLPRRVVKIDRQSLLVNSTCRLELRHQFVEPLELPEVVD